MKDTWASLRLIGQMAWQQGRGHAMIAMLETAGRVLEYLLPLFAGLIVTGVANRSLTTALIGGAGLAMSQGFAYLMAVIGVESRLILMERIGHAFDLRIGRMAGEAATLDHLENPDHQDQTQALAERLGVLGGAYNLLVNVANNLAGPLVTVLVAAYADWRLLLLLLVAAPAALLARATVRWEAEAEDRGAESGISWTCPQLRFRRPSCASWGPGSGRSNWCGSTPAGGEPRTCAAQLARRCGRLCWRGSTSRVRPSCSSG